MEYNLVLMAVAVMIITLLLKAPVFIALLAASAFYFVLSPGIPPQIFAQRFLTGLENIPLLAIAFFVCSGILMNSSGVTKRIMNFCNIVTYRMAGGLGQVNILLSTLMGGLSGSALADAAMEAKILVPEMEECGYSKEFSTVVTAMSAMITPLIPPGIYMILYGSIANISIGKLFVAGIGPGLLLCISMMMMVSHISKKRGYQVERTRTLSKEESKKVCMEAILPLCLPVIIIGGIRLGICTPTEAGSLAIIYSLILGFFVYKEMTLKILIRDIIDTVLTTSGIMLIVGSASVFAWVLTREQVPQMLTSMVTGFIHNKYVFLAVINAMLLIIGMFMEGNATLIVLVPLLAPIAKNYGINEIQFALTVIFNLGIGCVTPPMGTLMFVTCGITKCKVRDFIAEGIPFYILIVACLLVLTYFSPFTNMLVNLIY